MTERVKKCGKFCDRDREVGKNKTTQLVSLASNRSSSWKHSGPCECDNDKQEAGYCRFGQVLSEESGDKKNQQDDVEGLN